MSLVNKVRQWHGYIPHVYAHVHPGSKVRQWHIKTGAIQDLEAREHIGAHTRSEVEGI